MSRIKRLFIVVVCVAILLADLCYAENAAPIYDAAIAKLANYRDRADVESAVEGFSDIKSDYGRASLLKLYAEAILDIHDGNYQGAVDILTLLEKNNEFSTLIAGIKEEYYLPNCSELVIYANARISEDQEDYDTALSLYETVSGVWDAANRYLYVSTLAGEVKTEELAIEPEPTPFIESIDESEVIADAQGTKPEDYTPQEWLIGLWHMTEARKDRNDVISFDFNILSIDESGSMVVDWGDSGRINGFWDSEKQAITVFKNQTYVLSNGMLGGGNSHYSGLAMKNGFVIEDQPQSILGEWTMTEYRKEADKNDVIQFTFNIISVDANGKVDVYWGDSGRTTGQWNESLKTLTVYKEQVYVLHDGVFGGGSRRLSGVAIHQ